MFAKIKRNLRRLLSTNRVLTVIGLLILQVLWVSALVFSLYKKYYYMVAISFCLQIVFCLIIICTERNSAYKIGWILLVSTIPLFGCFFYLIYGLNISNKKLTKKIQLAKTQMPTRQTDTAVLEKIKNKSLGVLSFSEYLSKNSYPAFDGTKVKFFSSGESLFADVLEKIKSAQKYIFIEMFIIEEGKLWSELLDNIIVKAKQGVKVKILYDDFACITRLKRHYYKKLTSLHENIECLKFNTVTPFLVKSINNRDHRKIIIIDGVGYVGGANIADEYANISSRFGYWKDHAVRLTGKAVNGLIDLFTFMWNAVGKNDFMPEEYYSKESFASDGIVQPYGANPFDKSDIAFNVYLDIINRANRYLYISTPYLVPDSAIIHALTHAAKRGVDVRILVPSVPDKKIVYRLTKANFLPLMSAGVKIYTYTAGFNHAKTVVCDDEIALCGTPNFDYVSLFLNFEVGVFMYGCEEIEQITKEMLLLFDQSALVDKTEVKTGFWGRLLDAFLRTIEMLF